MDSMLARAGVDDDVKELSGPTQVTIKQWAKNTRKLNVK